MSNALLLPADGVSAESVPAALSSFVGRGADLERVETLVGQARLVTLAGAGGAGKTRLARETAASAARGSHFPDGIWWVELAPLPPGADPAPAAAAVLGVRPPLGADLAGAPADLLATAVGARRLLLVLDNCEHVVDGCAALADQLLRRCPGLTVLVTSREALGVEGEVVWPVTGLAHPTAADACGTDAAALAALGAYDAVRLFVDRARAVYPGFALTTRNAPAVAAITARLDGLPLALELAAANVATLGVEQLAVRLDDAFAVLTRGRRTALPRHRTLRALLDWSYHLLGDAERRLLAQLAVFRGPFGLGAVEAVGRAADAGDDADVLAAFGRLVEHSLVEVREEAQEDAGETRYRLLETVRQYGLARLAEATAEARAARARHAAWVAAWTGGVGPRTWSAARGRLVRRLERDADEIRSALEWAAAPGGDPMTGVRIAGALAWFWYSGVPWGEARARTDAALAAADAQNVPDAARPAADQAALAELLYPISGLAFFAGEPTRMLPLSDRAAALWDAVDAARGADPALDRALGAAAARGRATMRGMSGLAHAMLGATDTGLDEMGAAIDLMAGPEGDRWWHAVLLQRRALIASWGGRLDEAMADYGASVPRLRAVGETWFLSLALEGMAGVELARGDLAAAAAHARESAAVLADEPDAWFVSRSLDALAAVAAADGARAPGRAGSRARAAAGLLGAASALRERCGAEVIGPDRAQYAATVAAARATLGDAFAEPWGEGAALDLAGAFALAATVEVAGTDAAGSAAHAAAAPAAGAPGVAATPIATPEPTAAASAPEHRTTEVLAFGPMSVARDGVPVRTADLTPAKARELLLYLALHPEGRTKEQAAVALWPDASPAQVRNAFHVTLHQLRRVLGHKDAVAFDGRAYVLAGPPNAAGPMTVQTDVAVALAAVAAVRRAERELARRGGRGPAAVDAAGADEAALDAWRLALDRARRGALGEGEDAGEWLAEHQGRVRAAWAEAMEALARLYALRDDPAGGGRGARGARGRRAAARGGAPGADGLLRGGGGAGARPRPL
jgi:predicted ATPase